MYPLYESDRDHSLITAVARDPCRPRRISRGPLMVLFAVPCPDSMCASYRTDVP